MEARSIVCGIVLLYLATALTTLAQTTQAPAILVVPQNLDPLQQSLTINFHNQKTNTTSAPQTITLWNISSTDVTNLSAQLTAGKFTISSSTCSPNCTLHAGGHATIQVTFSSTSMGSFSSTLTFTGTASGLIPIPSVTLSGTAVLPPTTIPFSVNPTYTFHGIGGLNNNLSVDGDLYFGKEHRRQHLLGESVSIQRNRC